MKNLARSSTSVEQTNTAQRLDNRAREIIDTSAQLFAERGFNAVGVADICKAMGIGKAGLYRAIDSKQALLESIHNVCMVEVYDHAIRVVAEDRSPDEKLRELGAFMINLIVTKPHHIRVFLHEFSSLTGDGLTRCRERRRAYEALVEGVIDDAMEQGILQRADARLVRRAWFGLYVHTYTWLRPGVHDPAAISDLFGEIFMYGAVGGAARAVRAQPSLPR